MKNYDERHGHRCVKVKARAACVLFMESQRLMESLLFQSDLLVKSKVKQRLTSRSGGGVGCRQGKSIHLLSVPGPRAEGVRWGQLCSHPQPCMREERFGC